LGDGTGIEPCYSRETSKRIGVAEYFRGFYSHELRGKSYIDAMRIQNEEDEKSQ